MATTQNRGRSLAGGTRAFLLWISILAHMSLAISALGGATDEESGLDREETKQEITMPVASLPSIQDSNEKVRFLELQQLPTTNHNPHQFNDDDDYYVFLQKFPLQGSDGFFFHTEVLVCPRDEFDADDQQALDDTVASLEDFCEMDETWWTDKGSVSCVELGYGGGYCNDKCCGVPHGAEQAAYPLNAHRAMIANADTSQKSLYLYGTGAFDGNEAYRHVCLTSKTCWSNWGGNDYNPLTNNCNTFTSTVLSCVYGLSEKKPHLGPSDMVTVTCNCTESTVSTSR